jgi:hypothetical protein
VSKLFKLREYLKSKGEQPFLDLAKNCHSTIL